MVSNAWKSNKIFEDTISIQETLSNWPYSYLFKIIYHSYDAVLVRFLFTGPISI